MVQISLEARLLSPSPKLTYREVLSRRNRQAPFVFEVGHIGRVAFFKLSVRVSGHRSLF